MTLTATKHNPTCNGHNPKLPRPGRHEHALETTEHYPAITRFPTVGHQDAPQ